MAAEHYFTAQPSAPARRTEVNFSVAGREYRLRAAAGVFSADRLDPGTAVLLRKAELPGPHTTGRLLDLGCGYGAIACVLAMEAPLATIYAVDVNARALELTRSNAEALGLTINASEPDGVPADLVFGQIWSNPPIRVGKDGAPRPPKPLAAPVGTGRNRMAGRRAASRGGLARALAEGPGIRGAAAREPTGLPRAARATAFYRRKSERRDRP